MVERFFHQLKLLYNTTKESIINLKSVGITFQYCEPLTVILLMKKLDVKNRELFENFVKNQEKIQQWMNFSHSYKIDSNLLIHATNDHFKQNPLSLDQVISFQNPNKIQNIYSVKNLHTGANHG